MSPFQSSDRFTRPDPRPLMTYKLILHSTTTFIFHPSTSIPSLSSKTAFTRSTLAVGYNSKSPLRICSYTAQNPKRISPFMKPELDPVGPRDETELRPRRDTEAHRVASRISLGQDDLAGVKIAMKVVSASECLSPCKPWSNRLAEEARNKWRPRVIRRTSSSGEEKTEDSEGMSG